MASTTGTASISQLLRLKNESLGGLNRQKAGVACTKKKSVVIRAVTALTQPQQRSPASTGSVKRAMTMTEKILSRAAEKSALSPGENVWVNVDTLMTHDVCGPGTIGIFKREFGPQAKVCKDVDKPGIATRRRLLQQNLLSGPKKDLPRSMFAK